MAKQLESDWKIFTKNVPLWRERYLVRKNRDIAAVLSDTEKTPNEQFWDAMKLMEDESKILRNCLDGHSRSKMEMSLLLMFRHGLIDQTDAAQFSKELSKYILASKSR